MGPLAIGPFYFEFSSQLIDLPAMDVMGKADPYVVLHLKKTETKNKTRVPFLFAQKLSSFSYYVAPICFFIFSLFFLRPIFSNFCPLQVVNDSLNPVWNQTFDFVVEDGLHDMLILEVYDRSRSCLQVCKRCIAM